MRKIAFVTGGHGDIGSVIVEELAQNNIEVIRPRSTELDLSSVDYINSYFSTTRIPNIDIFIHCAGFNTPASFSAIQPEDIRKIFNINTFAFLELTKKLSYSMMKKKEGHILAISSLYGTASRRNRVSYTMSKHALNGAVKTLSIELGEHNIKVNSLSPGYVATKMTKKNNDAKQIGLWESRIPLGRLASPVDIAKVSLFLCSDNNQYISGQNIIVDGGYSIGGYESA